MGKKFFIVGNKGNMGRRYTAILKDLGHEAFGVDKNEINREDLAKMDGIIIATPTDNHKSDIENYIGFKKPILCEKPVVKDLKHLADLLDRAKREGVPFQMVNQYRYLIDRTSEGASFYNYFKHGADGLYWDCINIIGLAKGDWLVNETSPIWLCSINNCPINPGRMDWGYYYMVQDWIKNPSGDLGYIFEAHRRVVECIAK